jgi:phosphotransferase system enzyme I (PtsI)
MRYRGIGVCAGMALNRAFRLAPLPQLDYELRAGCSAAEALSAYTTAADRLKSDFRAIAKLHAGAARAELMEVQLAMLEDDAFVDRIKDDIAAGYAPEAAVLRAARSFEQMLQAIDDEYMTARADDVHDLGMRLACGIANVPYPSLSGLLSDCVVLARDLLPSMLMTAELKYIRGIATENGTRTSHISILTAGLEIPTVVACTGVMAARHGEMVFLDGEQGVVEDDLDAAAVEALSAREREYQLERGELLGFAGSESVTADGAHIGVLANIVNTVSLDKVLPTAWTAWGFSVRNFLFMNRSVLPGEEEQFAITPLRRKSWAAPPDHSHDGFPADKNAECLRLPKEENPFMGYQGGAHAWTGWTTCSCRSYGAYCGGRNMEIYGSCFPCSR